MHFLVISTPRADKPSAARENQKAWWDWLDPLVKNGTAKHVYTKLGRGAVIIFDVDSHETLHKLVNQWAECVPGDVRGRSAASEGAPGADRARGNESDAALSGFMTRPVRGHQQTAEASIVASVSNN